MFWTVFTFELAYWFKRPLTLLFFALFFLMAFFSTASDSFLSIGGTGQIHRNAPFVLASAMGILTAIGQVITTAIAGTAVLRDAQLGTEEMLFTTRLSKTRLPARPIRRRVRRSWLVIYSALPIGLLVGTLMPWVPADKLGPITLCGAFQPFFVIALPNLLFVSALLFAIGALTRKLFAVYITGIVLLVVWQITQQVVGNLDKLSLASLIDPFALTTTNVDDPLLERRGEEHAPDSARRSGDCRTGCCGSRSPWRCLRSSRSLFRLRLQQGMALAPQEGEARRTARTVAPPTPAVALRYDTAVVAASVRRAEPLSSSRRSSASRRFSRSR